MRVLPPTISTALASSNAQPTVSLASNDIMPRLTSFATLKGPKGRSSARLVASGSILRAVVGSGTDPNSLTIFRITSANISSASAWAAAGTIIASNAAAAAGCCLMNSGSTIRCFYYTTANNVVYRQSTDDGVTWGAETLVQACPAGLVVCAGIAATSNTDLHVVFYQFANAASGIYRTTFSASWSAWSSVGPASPSWGQVRGLAVPSGTTSAIQDPFSPNVDPYAAGGAAPTGSTGTGTLTPTPTPFASWYIFVGGADLRGLKGGIAGASFCWDGSSRYSPWTGVLPMDTPDNGAGYQYPTIHFNGTDGYYYAGFLYSDSGSVSGSALSRLHIFRTATGTTWHHYASLGNLVNYEVHVIWVSGVMYAFDAQTCYAYSGPPSALDITGDLLELQIHEKLSEPTRFSLRLSNNTGQYNSVPQLLDNAQITISLGYNGSTTPTHTCYIDAITWIDRPEHQELLIEGRDVTKFLDQICLTLQASNSSTLATAIISVTTAAEIALTSLPATSQFSQTLPNFTIVPGETWWNALKRLSDVYQFDMLITYADTLKIIERSASDASTWTYGTEHLGLHWQLSADQPNVVRVVGASTGTTNVFAETIDSANISSSGARRYRQIVDRLCDTAAKCLLKAQLALRDDQTQTHTGSMTVRLNPQHEVGDPITISSTNIGLASTKVRINEILTIVNWDTGQYEQHLGLELP